MKKALLIISILPLFSFLLKKDKAPLVYDAAYFDKTMVELPGGQFNMYIIDTSDGLWAEKKFKRDSLPSFYMHPYEVSNSFYLNFLFDIGKTDPQSYKSALPDTIVWRKKLSYNEPYVEYYFRHPAYKDYPVVGVSYEQCEMFCKWITEKYNSNPKRKFKKVLFSLPTKRQWLYAAIAESKKPVKDKQSNPKNYKQPFKLYPWGGPRLRNAQGMALANYTEIEQSAIMKTTGSINYNGKETKGAFLVVKSDSWASSVSDANTNADITAPVYSYWPNDAWLYNMAGNVEEYVQEKGITKGGGWDDTGYYLRNDVEEKYDSSNYTSSSRGFRFVMQVLEK